MSLIKNLKKQVKSVLNVGHKGQPIKLTKNDAPVSTTNANEDFKRAQDEQYLTKPGVQLYQQTEAEKRAGVLPPSYEGMRDIRTGELLSPFKTDVYKGEALQALKQQAFAQGESPWAAMQLQGQKMEEAAARDKAVKNQMQASSMAQSQLARSGGLSGGARALLARQSLRDLLSSNQDIARAGGGQRLDIQKQDLARKEGLLGKFGDLETGAQASDIGRLTGDVSQRAAFDTNRYNQQMGAWGASQSAQAQRDAAKASAPKPGLISRITGGLF